jgi:hypothetical protein
MTIRQHARRRNKLRICSNFPRYPIVLHGGGTVFDAGTIHSIRL